MKKKPTKKISKSKTRKRIRKNPNGFIVFRENENDKNSVIISNMPDPMDLNDDEKKEFSRSVGMITGKLSKFMLEMGGMDVSYKINGEDINDIKKMQELDIKGKIELAIKEERYEDAQQLKNILENKDYFANSEYKLKNDIDVDDEEEEIENEVVEMIEFIEQCRGFIVSQKTANKLIKICQEYFNIEHRDLGIYNALVLRRLNLRHKPVGQELFILLKK